MDELIEVDESEEDSCNDDDSETEEDKEFCDPTAEFVADVRNALGNMAAVDSDQVIFV